MGAFSRASNRVRGRALFRRRLHDLRRTGVSTLARFGFDSIVVDKLLAHQPAKLRGVAAVYQRHEFAKEQAASLDTWAAHVIQRGAAPSNVIPLTLAADGRVS
jgi:hypothetical protein